MPDQYKNFAVGSVATAPTPPTSGASVTLGSGQGTRFPVPPFNATVWPAATLPDPTNAEIVRVTGLAGDVLTISRAQEASSARAIGVGDLIAATITEQTLTDLVAGVTGPTGPQGPTGETGATGPQGPAGVIAAHASTHAAGGADVFPVSAAARLLGRGSVGGAGDVQEITLSNSMILTGTELSTRTGIFNYTYNIAGEPPNAGQVRLNALYPWTAVTKMWLRFVSADGQDLYWGIMVIPSGATLLLQDKDDHTAYVRFTTTGEPSDKGLYAEIPVMWQANGTSVNTAAQVFLRVAGTTLSPSLLDPIVTPIVAAAVPPFLEPIVARMDLAAERLKALSLRVQALERRKG